MSQPKTNPIILLIQSRKAIVAFIGIAGAIILFAFNLITPDQLAEFIKTLITVLMATIAGEDIAQKINGS
jgi:uncharacterized SAM-binding protein YcdF (DUF218 family)